MVQFVPFASVRVLFISLNYQANRYSFHRRFVASFPSPHQIGRCILLCGHRSALPYLYNARMFKSFRINNSRRKQGGSVSDDAMSPKCRDSSFF